METLWPLVREQFHQPDSLCDSRQADIALAVRWEVTVVLGLMQSQGLMISTILTHAARHHGSAEVVSRTHENTTHRYTWAGRRARSRRLVRVLQKLGVAAGDRVGTLAWNGYRHLEVYYAAPGMQAICHTINPAPASGRHRLHHQPRRRQRAVRRSQLRRR